MFEVFNDENLDYFKRPVGDAEPENTAFLQ
jgi:hypothetical protein